MRTSTAVAAVVVVLAAWVSYHRAQGVPDRLATTSGGASGSR